MITRISEYSGVPRFEIKRVMDELPTDDPAYAAGFALARGLAVNIRGDRDAWNRQYAHGYAKRIRNKV